MPQQRPQGNQQEDPADIQKERPNNIDAVIRLISNPKFIFSKLEPESFAPAPDDQWTGGGAAYVVAKSQGKMKITQLRKLFAEIKRLDTILKGKDNDQPLDNEFYTRIWLLHPELAYARGRGLIDDSFFRLIRLSLSKDKLNTVADFHRLADFITAIVAYRKYLG